MDFFHAIVAVLAMVVLVLTSLTGWLYMQQSRLMQAVSALTVAITAPPATFYEAVKEFPIPEETPETDDRVSVKEEEPEVEVEEEKEDELVGEKTVAQLRELLNEKGIPFNKSDKKTILVNLLKAAS